MVTNLEDLQEQQKLQENRVNAEKKTLTLVREALEFSMKSNNRLAGSDSFVLLWRAGPNLSINGNSIKKEDMDALVAWWTYINSEKE